MIDVNMQHCFIRSLIDSNVHPSWLSTSNFVNLYSGNDCKSTTTDITCMFLTNDRYRLLYITNQINAFDTTSGLPWAQKYANILKPLTLNQMNTFSFSYSGLFFCEYSHNEQLWTLKEHMLTNSYTANLFSNYIRNVIRISKYHLIPFLFSEELLLVDAVSNNLLLPSPNFILSITHPLPMGLCKMFKNRLHPLMVYYLNKVKANNNSNLKNTKRVVLSGLYSPIKLKKICTRLIERDAASDRVYFLSTFIYYLAAVATFWKLRKQFIIQSNISSIRDTNFRQNKKHGNGSLKKCTGVCSQATNYLEAEPLKDLIHNYLCIEVTLMVPIKLKKATELYIVFNACLMELESYLLKLENVYELN